VARRVPQEATTPTQAHRTVRSVVLVIGYPVAKERMRQPLDELKAWLLSSAPLLAVAARETFG
jgi:hypothetical protein